MWTPEHLSVFMLPLHTTSPQNRAGYSFSPTAAFGLGCSSLSQLGDEDTKLAVAAPWCLSVVSVVGYEVSTFDCFTFKLA